jgi:hypothetical protein
MEGSSLNHSPEIKQIAAALVKAQADIKGAVKDSTNPHFRSKYADLGSIIDAVKAPLLRQGIAFLQGVHDAVDGVAVETMLIHSSGEWISSTLRIPAVKQDAQGYGSATTYGRRYGLQSMCGVPAEDDDGHAATASTSSRITPNSGAGDDLDAKQKEMVQLTRDKILEALKDNKDWDAYSLCESLTDEMMAEKLYLWSLLDSKQRRRIKNQAEAAKQQKAA